MARSSESGIQLGGNVLFLDIKPVGEFCLACESSVVSDSSEIVSKSADAYGLPS
jgi:hypothetical protein